MKTPTSVIKRRLLGLGREIEAQAQIDTMQRGVLWNISLETIRVLIDWQRLDDKHDAFLIGQDEYDHAYRELCARRDAMLGKQVKP